MKKFLYWAPRVLSILFVAFVSIFALDVFEEGKSAGAIALALLIHLIPTIIGIVIIVIAWKRELVGGWLFVALGIGFIFIGNFESGAILLFMIPLTLIGAMFLWHHYKYSAPIGTPEPPKAV